MHRNALLPTPCPNVAYLVQFLRIGSSNDEEKVITHVGDGRFAVTPFFGNIFHVGVAWQQLTHAQQWEDKLAKEKE